MCFGEAGSNMNLMVHMYHNTFGDVVLLLENCEILMNMRREPSRRMPHRDLLGMDWALALSCLELCQNAASP